MATVTRRLAALLGASGAGLTDSATASKITTDSINDDAVTNAKIGTDAVNADSIVANAVGTSEVADNVLTATDLAANSVGESELSVDYTAQSVPHIIPGVLYPSYVASGTSNKLLDGTTDHSGAFGTEQSDGRKYYYTNIKGSKPIKDPRIGAYFGSQRHKFKSLQKLEEETSAHGDSVYSVDGRDWIRRVGDFDVHDGYGQQGHFLGHTAPADATNSKYFEIVGYFNAANYISYTATDRDVNVFIDGTQNPGSTITAGTTTINTPLNGRCVDSGSVINIPITGLTTPGIHTLKIANVSGDYLLLFGVELISQDTTSDANKSKIQIPAQNVVSAGKKFTISATADHYDPFSAKTDGSAWTSPTSGTNNANSAASWPTNIDTAHSLGLDKWVDGSSYYRPYNGGRVVKYVDSTGTIKTAVTVMPPNAKSIYSGDISKKAKNAGNTTHKPTFEDETTSINEDELHEVAKTFHWREFGNGGDNYNSSYRDATVVTTSSTYDIAYVMDDGITSLCADDISSLNTPANSLNLASNDRFHMTFIGTGISMYSPNWAENANAWHHIAQNLPYGTHILRIFRAADNNSTILLDGVEVKGSTGTAPWKNLSEITYHQPKRPPIPEDAVVLADYMLMADYVQQTDVEPTEISKGLRLVGASRDIKYDGAIHGSYPATTVGVGYLTGLPTGVSPTSGGTPLTLHLPFFGTNIQYSGHSTNTGARTYTFTTGSSTGSSVTKTSLDNSIDVDADQDVLANSGLSLGQHTVNVTMPNGGYNSGGLLVVSPIHTSSHYQSFETPYLHELVGGDRNMEQHNLVCSPDGKTWDEITRDKSYLASDLVLSATTNTATGWSTTIVFDEWRDVGKNKARFNKDSWAIAYDRLICLKDATYEMITSGSFDSHQDIYINGTDSLLGASGSHSGITLIRHMKRGDYIEVKGDFGMSDDIRYGHFFIKRVY